MDINFTALVYLFLRLAPFILVSFFSISSIFNYDFKGAVYLLGLLASSVIVLSLESIISSISPGIFDAPSQRELTCDFLNITDNSPLSSLPLGSGIISYTFSYLLYVIIKYEYVANNVPLMIFFSVLILSDFIWHITHSCYNQTTVLITIILFASCGVLFSFLLDKLKLVDLQYFTHVSGQQVCSRPSKQSFHCSIQKKNLDAA
tara:strand:+ start:435 stop:1046 length:612 start_codon:yes stop_codon:yes gene_type:complete